MEELSIEEKAKAYDEAYKFAENIHKYSSNPAEIKRMEYLFPELKESEDEKIRKELIEMVKLSCTNGDDVDKKIAWLKKQVKQEIADKAEPKFKNGQWIVWQDKCYKVNYNGCGYELVDQNGLSTSLEYGTVDDNAHIWDITKDAKDGDVLYSPCFKLLWIYKDEKTCHVGSNLNYNSGSIVINKPVFIPTDVQPATKEQRDTLMKATAYAGYVFDFDKKELKNIEQSPIDVRTTGYWYVEDVEQNSAWSEEDEKHYQGCLNLMKLSLDTKPYPYYNDYLWLKSLKDRVQSQNLIIADEELAQAKKDAYSDALDKIEYHSEEPTFDDG